MVRITHKTQNGKLIIIIIKNKPLQASLSFIVNLYEPRCEKTGFLHICENKDADQLHGDREADECLCFRYTDSTIPLLPKTEISSLYASVIAQPHFCRAWSETPKTGFLTTRLILALPLHYTELYELRHEKTCILHMRKQRRRSAVR